MCRSDSPRISFDSDDGRVLIKEYEQVGYDAYVDVNLEINPVT